MLVCVGMVPWIVYLAISLPKNYQAANWKVLWVGFDAALVAVLLSTALTAWWRKQIVAPLVLVAATLLLCDAWFDVVTSFGRPGGWISIVTAICAELPVAFAFLWLFRQIVLGTIAEERRRVGNWDPPRRLRDIQVLDADPPHTKPYATGRPVTGDKDAPLSRETEEAQLPRCGT